MEALISTYHNLSHVDLTTGNLRLIEDSQKYYHGITWDSQKNLYLTHSNLAFDAYSPIRVEKDHSPNQEVGFVSKNFVKKFSPFAAPHQVNYIDDCLVVSNTGRNCLSLFKKLSRQDHFPNADKMWDFYEGEKVGSHFNSAFLYKHKLYVLGHNFDNPSFMLVLNWPSLELLESFKLPGVSYAHNVWVTDERILVGDGGTGFIYDCRSKQPVYEVKEKTKYIVRGMAATDKHLIVGCTPHIPRREDRYKGKYSCQIHILDLKSLTLQDKLEFKGMSALMEIRLLNVEDKCHTSTILTSEELFAKLEK
jgi:hypothetical protein